LHSGADNRQASILSGSATSSEFLDHPGTQIPGNQISVVLNEVKNLANTRIGREIPREKGSEEYLRMTERL
jgi:hypothetical protein